MPLRQRESSKTKTVDPELSVALGFESVAFVEFSQTQRAPAWSVASLDATWGYGLSRRGMISEAGKGNSTGVCASASGSSQHTACARLLPSVRVEEL